MMTMERWSGILRVSLNPKHPSDFLRVAASLSLPSSAYDSSSTIGSCVNAVFFTGDRVEGTGNPVIERLSDATNIASILVSKLRNSSSSVNVWVNVWVVEASLFSGPFAVYKEFVPTLNSFGDPDDTNYKPQGFPATTSLLSLLQNCMIQAKRSIQSGLRNESSAQILPSSPQTLLPCPAKTILLGFSKGGVVLNQLVTELAHYRQKAMLDHTNTQGGEGSFIIPTSIHEFFQSIMEIHYIDVGLNRPGAYLTDIAVIHGIVEFVKGRDAGIRIVVHGTPRQWREDIRPWVFAEKNRFVKLLADESQASNGKLQVFERMYFAGEPPSLQMHFQVIESMDVVC